MLIAQITDTHIKAGGKLAYGKVDTEAALAHCLRQVNDVTPAVDVVLVTGDLVDTGRPEEYRALRALLGELHAPCYVIPGNHDERNALRNAFAADGYLEDGSPYLHLCENRPYELLDAVELKRLIEELGELGDQLERIVAAGGDDL